MRFLLLAAICLGLRALALEISQIEFYLVAKPGEVREFSFSVRNDLERPQKVIVYLGDWDRDPYGKNIFYEPGTLPRSLCRWLTVSPTSFVLGPGEVQEIKGVIRVPEEGLEGTYWGIVFVQGEPRLLEEGVLAIERFGVKIYVTVGGEVSGRIEGIEVKGLNPLWAEVTFANTGTVNLDTVVLWFEIFDSQGNSLARLQPEPFPCLPGYRRIARVQTDLRPGPGTYLAVATVDIGTESLIAGQALFRVKPLSLEPLKEGWGLPRDLDGDGFFEDVNGDGAFDQGDILALLETFDSAVVQQNWRAFDFDNDGQVTWNDVFKLQEILSSAGGQGS